MEKGKTLAKLALAVGVGAAIGGCEGTTFTMTINGQVVSRKVLMKDSEGNLHWRDVPRRSNLMEYPYGYDPFQNDRLYLDRLMRQGDLKHRDYFETWK